MPLQPDLILTKPTDCVVSRKRPPTLIIGGSSVKRRRTSLASVDISREISSVTYPELAEETSADRFIPARPKSVIPLNVTPRTNRIARVLGLADDRLLNYSDAIASTPEAKMLSLLRKSASQLFQPTSTARPTSVVSNLGVRKQFVLALDGPGIPANTSAYPLAWSSTNCIAVASGNNVYYQNLEDRLVSRLCKLNSLMHGMLYGIEWGGTEMQNTLALGTTAGTVQLWDVAGGGRGLCSWADPECSCIGGMSWYGHSLAVGRSHGDISIFDARQQSEVRRVKGHKGRVNALKFSHDGKYIGSGDESGGVYIWDARACKSLSDEKRWGRMKHSGPVRSLSWCPWKSDLVATGSIFPEGKIRIWTSNSCSTSSLLHTIPLNTSVTSLHWSPHCKELLSTHGSSWAPPTSQRRLRGEPPNFTQVPSSLTNSITVHSYPALTRLVSVLAHPAPVGHSCLGPDGTMVFTICPKEETMKMWKVWGQREKVEKEESIFGKCAIR